MTLAGGLAGGARRRLDVTDSQGLAYALAHGLAPTGPTVRPGPARPVDIHGHSGSEVGRRRRRAPIVGLIAILVGLASLLVPAGAAAASLSITTPYPAVAVAPGSKVSFELTVKPPTAELVRLRVGDVPAGWSATLRGGGYVVDGVYADPAAPPTVRLDVSVAPDARDATVVIPVTATAGGESATLSIEVRPTAAAAGQVTLATDFPALRGPSAATYRFNMTLQNDTAQDLTFSLAASGPDGWDVQVRPTSQSQAASAVVNAGSSTGIELTAAAPDTAAAGTYPISVTATSGDVKVEQRVGVEIVGTYSMTLSTPDQRLNASGTAGAVIQQQLEIDNTGTAPLENVKLTATPPGGWTVTFQPTTVDTVAPGDKAQLTAFITPSNDAIAGDYVVTFSASNDAARASSQFRVTVETSILWAAVGGMLILAVVVGLGWVFQRYGRR